MLLLKLLAIMATKFEADVISLQDVHEVVEGVEAEDDQNGREVMPLSLQDTGYSLLKALKFFSIYTKYVQMFELSYI